MTPLPQHAQEPQLRYTEDEYLAFERQAEERHEYLDGKIYEMAGESPQHGAITSNLSGQLYLQLRGKRCQYFSKDTKVRSGPLPKSPRSTRGLYSYPDLVIVCGELRFLDEYRDVLINPVVLIEVSSPSTEARDHVDKWERYQRWLTTLNDYVLVAQERPLVKHFSRHVSGGWLYFTHTELSDELVLASVECRLRLSDIYERVSFPPPADELDDEDYEE